jgi:leucyl aminopeptidase
MPDFATLLLPDKGQPATLLRLVDKKGLDAWLKAVPERVRQAAGAQGFKGEAHQLAVLPGDKADWSAAVGVRDTGALGPWCLAKAAEALPEGTYRLEGSAGPAALGWLLGHYSFDRYKVDPAKKGPRIVLTDDPAKVQETVLLAEATALVRDLVNIPAQDMGPKELESAISDVAKPFSAALSTTSGSALETDYPMIAAVGRAASKERAPRLVELEWGNPKHPRIAIVGKGVCFDSGGLDIKNASGMRLMKKDMGGAAHALALALLVMKSRLPVRLHLLIPAVENAIAGNAFRPGDILKSRKGLTVEIGNTDAEGRLVLADLLHFAGEHAPALVLDGATLTGAARVALGPDLPALFCNDEALAATLLAGGLAAGEPLWRLPLHDCYDIWLDSPVAEMNNVAGKPMAGAIVAALFLRRFAPAATPWAHLDLYAWNDAGRPGQPEGGEATGLRALLAGVEAWAAGQRGSSHPND